MTHRVRANAKVNLHLEVLNKRGDGYHNIFSLNAELNLFDLLHFKKIKISDNPDGDLRIEIIQGKGKFRQILDSLSPEDNLISKSIRQLFKKTGKSGEITIILDKNIPAGAGLAGGSADAAAALNFLNACFEKKSLCKKELINLGAGIGADIPYCLTGGFAICKGIGNKIEKIKGTLKHSVLIACPFAHVNTADAYRLLERDCKNSEQEEALQNRRSLFTQGLEKHDLEHFKSCLFNDFESPIFRNYPGILMTKKEIEKFEPDYVTMTGSGSAIIGLFSDYDKALETKKYLIEKTEATKIIKDIIITHFATAH